MFLLRSPHVVIKETTPLMTHTLCFCVKRCVSLFAGISVVCVLYVQCVLVCVLNEAENSKSIYIHIGLAAM